jgi:predicted amidohydrolase YtcJ
MTPQTAPAEWAFQNGRIHLMDRQNRTVPAAAVSADGRIIAVGENAAIAAHCAPHTRIRDLGGSPVIPAFVDPHGHFPESGFCALHRVDLMGPPLGTCACLSDVFDRLREKARATPRGEFVFGVFFDQTQMRERRFPTKEELDAISDAHPIWVMHMSFHAGAGNSRALQFAGINKDTPQPRGGFIEKNSRSGEPTGLLEEPAAMGPIADAMLGSKSDRFGEGLRWAAAEYAAQGVTTAQNAFADAGLLADFAAAARSGEPNIRIVALPDGRALSDAAHIPPDIPADGPLRIGPRKLFSDGSIQVFTAYLSRPYHTPCRDDAAYRGYPIYSRTELRRHVCRLHEAGHQIHIHANGDAAADDVLAAIAAAQESAPREDHRHTVIHGQTLREDQLDLMRDLGVTVSFFSFHVYVWGDRHRDIFLGPERAARISPAHSAMRRGMRFTIHNDTPVTPMRPMQLIWCAVNRLTACGEILGEEQRISALAALRAHTIDAAWQVFLEDELGSIEPGKRADFALLDADPLAVPPEKLRDIAVLETIRDGKTIYQRK